VLASSGSVTSIVGACVTVIAIVRYVVAACFINAGIISTEIVVITVDRLGLTTIKFATPEFDAFVFVSCRTIDRSMLASEDNITSVKSTSITIIAVY
jgi:hypothetical protein